MITYISSIILGYLIGSISPSYILGRFLKKIDIRTIGEKNAGTTNAFKELGIIPGIITGFYDLAKGLMAMYCCYLLGLPEPVIYLSGLAAIVGHIFPFYLDFRGGEGVATATGILFYCLIALFQRHFLPWESLIILAFMVLAILFITKQKGFLALIVMPALIFIILKNYSINYLTIYTAIILIFIFGVNIYEAVRRKIFKLKPDTIIKILPWRTAMRPLSVIFPILYFYLDKNIMLWTTGIIGGIFLIMDIVRLISSKVNLYFFSKTTKIFKKREQKRFSSITLFFMSMFFVILLFDKYIAITSIMFLIFGDVFAKFFGSEYGKIKIGDKTLEGSIAFFAASILVGYILLPYVGLSPSILIAGAFAATIAELAPLGVNDNLSIGILSASAMLIMQNYIL